MILNNQRLWAPTKETNMNKFIQFCNKRHGTAFETYEQLYDFSVTNLEAFWTSVWDFCGIISSKEYDTVLESVPMDQIPKWFQGSLLNYAENMLRFDDERLALVGVGENQVYGSLTHHQLILRVGQCAQALKQSGVQKGDRVVAYIPNCIDAVIYMLATSSLGAIWSSASPDFGVVGVLDRFKQVDPKILVSVNAVTYNGKTHDHLQKLKQVAEGLPTLQKVIVIPFVDQIQDISFIQKSVRSHDFLSAFELQVPVYEQVSFDHPLAILYSSGTTGKPKCIVHSHGGAIIQHLKEHVIHGSMSEDDVFFYYTTTGWMMWNWLLSGLGTGATVILYDGSPFKPTPLRLWELVDQFKISHFGVSAKYIQSLEEAGVKPGFEFGLDSLKVVYSTGSPLKPESFDYVYKNIHSNVCLGSITGGTDIISLFAGHNTALPVHRGEIQCRSLGMAIESWNEQGKPVFDEPGDLVCTKPFPVMPVYFWNDPGNEKYKQAYFSNFEGVWYHGDYVHLDSKTGGVLMLGRSDGTLNPNGVRFGSAELYNILAEFKDVQDSLAVGQKQGEDERVVLFCKMVPGKQLTPELLDKIRARIRTLLSPRHVPAVILPIADIPYTLTGKKVEVAVKKIISGKKISPSSSLANPESLKLYYDIRELKTAPSL
ncbi:hypothetical protein EDD86DRAFT_208747 [Gorgonomyces haynaldii]|nr:hypothetical protein EDD86DRAFT_208747 [Gorgonomyces haynaldii]